MAFRHAETTLSHAKWRASGVASFRLSPTTIARHEESDRDQGTGGMRSTRHVFLLMNGAVDRSNPVNDGIFTISRISAINRMLMNRKPPRHTSLLHSTLGFDGSLTGHELGVFYLGMSQIHRRCKVTNCWLIRCLHNAPKRNIIYIYDIISIVLQYLYIYISHIYRMIQLWWIQQFGAAKEWQSSFNFFESLGFWRFPARSNLELVLLCYILV